MLTQEGPAGSYRGSYKQKTRLCSACLKTDSDFTTVLPRVFQFGQVGVNPLSTKSWTSLVVACYNLAFFHLRCSGAGRMQSRLRHDVILQILGSASLQDDPAERVQQKLGGHMQTWRHNL